MTAAECAPELGCFNTGMATACLKYCDVNAPACPGGQTCAQLQDKNKQPITIGNWTFGVCQ